MNCALSPKQQEKLFAKVVKDMLNSASGKKPFEFKSYAKDFYNSVLKATNDHGLALTYVSLLPQNISMAFGVKAPVRQYLASSIGNIVPLESSFSDIKYVERFLNVAPVKPEEIKQVVKTAVVDGSKPKPVSGPLVKEVDFQGMPMSPFSSWGQEAYYLNFDRPGVDQSLKNIADPEKKFHYDTIRELLEIQRSQNVPFSEVEAFGNKGFTLVAISSDNIPESSKHPEMKDPDRRTLLERTGQDRSVALVIADKYGNPIYFDSNGQVTYDREQGRVAHTFMRIPVEQNGKFALTHGKIVPVEDIIKKENRLRKSKGIPELSGVELNNFIKSIEVTRQSKFKTLSEIATQVKSGQQVILNIEGGSSGHYNRPFGEPESLSKVNVPDQSIANIDTNKTAREGDSLRGYSAIDVPGVSTPVQLDRMKITKEIAEKIADVLFKPLTIGSSVMTVKQKAEFVKQFFYSGDKQFLFKANVVADLSKGEIPMKLSVNGQQIVFPDPQDELAIEQAKKELVELLLTTGPNKGPVRMNYETPLLRTGIYTDYTISGNSATRSTGNYHQFVRQHGLIFAEVQQDGSIAELNSYFSFSLPEESVKQLKGEKVEHGFQSDAVLGQEVPIVKEKEPEVKVPVKRSALKKKDGLDPKQFLDKLNKSKDKSNKATEEQIAAARKWFEASPLSKHIKFETLFNVVNSDAWADWNLDGIRLYAGSNYTDLYHEAWHGFSQLFLTASQKTSLYSEARKIKGLEKATDFEIEEFLAEEFRKYSMGKSTSVGKSIFSKIWEFLKKLFGGTTEAQVVTQAESIAAVKEVFDKLYFGQINEYKMSVKNVQFVKLNKSAVVEPISDNYEVLSLEQSRLLVSTMDSLISEAINAKNAETGSSKFTSSIFLDKKNLESVYNYTKARLLDLYNDFIDKAEAETNEFEKQALLNKAELLDFAIENFGDITKSIEGREDKGLVAFHRNKSTYMGISSKLVEMQDVQADDFSKGVKIGDRKGNELSLKDMANGETLYLIKSIHKVDSKGEVVLNPLGVPELADFSKTWNAIVRTISGYQTPDQMFAKLVAAQSIHPEFSQLLSKLGLPFSGPNPAIDNPTEIDPNFEFDMWTRFWQDFNKPRIPLVQLLLEHKPAEVIADSSTLSVSTKDEYEMRGGEASADTFGIRKQFKTKFKSDDPSVNPYILRTEGRVNYLNVKKVVTDFNRRDKVPAGKEYAFLQAIGFYLPAETPVLKEMLSKAVAKEGIDKILQVITDVYKYNQANPEKQLLLTDPINFLERMDMAPEYKEFKRTMNIRTNEAGRVKSILSFHGQVGADGSSFSVLTAEGERQFEHSLNNSMTVMISAINQSKSFQELIARPEMSHMHPDRNPFVLRSVWMNSIFKLDVDPNDPTYGEKRKTNTESNAPDAVIKLENLSGVQIVNAQTMVAELGIATSRSDRTTKFLTDFHMLLLYGRVEMMRHASKSTAYDITLSEMLTDPNKTDKSLYIAISDFVSPENSSEYAGAQKGYDIMKKYVAAELARIVKVKQNRDAYKNAVGYNKEVAPGVMAGETFTAFADVLSHETKQELINLVWDAENGVSKGSFEDLIESNPALSKKVQGEIKKYFAAMINQNGKIMAESSYFHPEIKKKIERELGDTISPSIANRAAVRAFTYNTWIHNMESLINIYGDLAQYNHFKEEFHKRNAGMGSTGYMYRTDKGAQDFINRHVGRGYANKLRERGLPVADKKFDGTADTAIIQDMNMPSSYLGKYETVFRKYFTDMYSKRDLPEEKKKAIIEKKVKSAIGPYQKMTEGDGQGWVTMDFYRIMRRLEGKWSPKHEALYQKVISGQTIEPADAMTFFPPYKVQYYGPLQNSVEENGLPITAFHKFSLYPLVPGVVDGTNLEKLHHKMIKDGIDYALFESGSKVGGITANGKYDPLYSRDKETGQRVFNENVKLTKNTIHLSYMKNQQDIADYFKGKSIFSTQLRKLILEGLFENGKAINPKFEALAKVYEANIDRLTELKKQELLREAGWVQNANGELKGDIKNLISMIQDEMDERDFPEHEKAFFKMEKDQLIYDISLHPSAEKIEKVLTAIVNNRLIKQKMKGESLVQVAASMFEKTGITAKYTNPTAEDLAKYGSNDLPTYDQPEEGKPTTAMRVKIALQGDFVNLLNIDHSDGMRIRTLERLNEMLKDEAWREKHRKQLTMVGVRIPVQGLNSMEFMEVHEFLPASAGNIIVPPSEIVAKSGADFDIDKLTVFMPAIYEHGDFATREFETMEALEAEIQKWKDERNKIMPELLTVVKQMRKDLKAGKKISRERIKELKHAIAGDREVKKEYLSDIRHVIQSLQHVQRMPKWLVELANDGGDSKLSTALMNYDYEALKRLDTELASMVTALRTLNWDIENENSEKNLLFDEIERQETRLWEIDEEVENERRPYNLRISQLTEQKRKFINTVENELIGNIRAILELPENFVSLIRPNDTDIVRPIAMGTGEVIDGQLDEGLSGYVQKFDPKQRVMDHSAEKVGNKYKNIAPTRVLEYGYNLFKHEQNNTGKQTLGMAAIENTYNTIFNRIGAYIPNKYLAEKEERNEDGSVKTPARYNRMILLLDHHPFKYKKDGVEETGISLSNLFDTTGDDRVADVISQIMNGLVDIEKDPWIANIQGNMELMPILMLLLKAGTPLKQAAWFVSQPLILKYVDTQREIKSTFHGPRGGEGSPDDFRKDARERVLNTLVSKGKLSSPAKGWTNKAVLNEAFLKTQSTFPKGKIEFQNLETIVKTADEESNEAVASFLHFLEIEDFMKGIADLKFKTNVDTKKSADLFNATKRLAEIQKLSENAKLPSELIEKIMEESVLGSFFIQDFQINLWSGLMKFRTNPVVTDYLMEKMSSFNFRDKLKKTFGKGRDEQYVRVFKNDLVSYILQNGLKRFDLKEGQYKGFPVKMQFVDKLEHGAFVKDGVMYIDKAQIELDFNTGAYAKKRPGGPAPVSTDAFTWNGVKSQEEYEHFVVEREYLRSIISMDEFMSTPEYRDITKDYRANFPEAKQEAIDRRAYEEYIKDKALANIFNFYSLFKDPVRSVGRQFLSITLKYPNLAKEYSLVDSLTVDTDLKTNMQNLMLRDKDLDADKVNTFQENYSRLADPSVKKVEDELDNKRISKFFQDLAVFAYLQSGLNKSQFSITDVVPYEPFLAVIDKPMKDFTARFLTYQAYTEEQAVKKLGVAVVTEAVEGKLTVRGNIAIRKQGGLYLINERFTALDKFSEHFEHQNSVQNKNMKNRFKTYNLTTERAEARKELISKNFNPTIRPNVVTFNSSGKPDYLKTLAKKFESSHVFVFNDTVLGKEQAFDATANEMSMRKLSNAHGIRVSDKTFLKDALADTNAAMTMIYEDLQPLRIARDEGKVIAFPSQGVGAYLKSANPSLFVSLSRVLYQEFGYVNPGSISEKEVRSVVESMQGISQQEVEELIRNCK